MYLSVQNPSKNPENVSLLNHLIYLCVKRNTCIRLPDNYVQFINYQVSFKKHKNVTFFQFLIVLVTLNECDSSDHPVSVVVVVVGVNFLDFSTSSLEPLHGFASNFVWMFFGWTPTKFGKIGVLPIFFMELWVILCNFCAILKKASIKPLTRNRSYLVWRVPRGSSFLFVQIRSL